MKSLNLALWTEWIEWTESKNLYEKSGQRTFGQHIKDKTKLVTKINLIFYLLINRKK